MTALEVTDLLNVDPFQPLRLHISDGKIYEIIHPDQVLVTPTMLIIGVGRGAVQGHDRIVARVEHCALSHVTRIAFSEA
jgi:hypothetical protein